LRYSIIKQSENVQSDYTMELNVLHHLINRIFQITVILSLTLATCILNIGCGQYLSRSSDSPTKYLDVFDRSLAEAAPCWRLRPQDFSVSFDGATEKYIENIADSRYVTIVSPSLDFNRIFNFEANLLYRKINRYTQQRQWRCERRRGTERSNSLTCLCD